MEQKLEKALKNISEYYLLNSLMPSTTKTQVCAFHLNTRKSRYKVHIEREENILQNEDYPKYLEVVLDRSFIYNTYCRKSRYKVTIRNQLLKKLGGNQWNANPTTLRTATQTLCCLLYSDSIVALLLLA